MSESEDSPANASTTMFRVTATLGSKTSLLCHIPSISPEVMKTFKRDGSSEAAPMLRASNVLIQPYSLHWLGKLGIFLEGLTYPSNQEWGSK